MPRAAPPKFIFDPKLCPLLAGLPPEEQRIRMATDPLIRNCVRDTEAGKFNPHDCAPGKPPRRTERAGPRARSRAPA